MKEFKIRCSAIGQIMSEPRSKAAKEAGELGATAKSYCELWIKENLIYNRKKMISSKYLTKGIECEPQSIERINKHFDAFYSKNAEHFENDFMTGTPDVIGFSKIIDVKNSYDFTTFPLFEKSIPEINYFYQLQGYMKLTGNKHAQLIYTLENLPPELIEMELNKLGLEYTEENEKMFIYDDVADEYRIKIFNIDYDETIIKKIESQVLKCRNYINSLI